jgi:hypothetical protein
MRPLLAPVPRRVPTRLTAQLLFGGKLSGVSWLCLGIGLAFSSLFVSSSELSTWNAFGGKVVREPAEVIDVYETNSAENDDAIYGTRFSYTHAGKSYEGVSFSTSRPHGPGAKVEVEVDAKKPEIARIQGMRLKPFGVGVAFVLVFPLLGAVGAFWGLYHGAKGHYLLSHGEYVLGELVECRETSFEVNDEPVWALCFSYHDASGAEHELRVKTTDPDALTDESSEPLLYLPNRPKFACLLDDLPGMPRFDSDGELVSVQGAGYRTLVWPALGVLIPAVAAVWRWIG